MSCVKRQKYAALKDKLPRLVDDHYANREKLRNSSRRKEEAEPQWRQCPVVDMSGGGNKVQCCKEQYCIGTWNIKVNWKWSNRRRQE